MVAGARTSVSPRLLSAGLMSLVGVAGVSKGKLVINIRLERAGSAAHAEIERVQTQILATPRLNRPGHAQEQSTGTGKRHRGRNVRSDTRKSTVTDSMAALKLVPSFFFPPRVPRVPSSNGCAAEAFCVAHPWSDMIILQLLVIWMLDTAQRPAESLPFRHLFLTNF